MKKKNETSDNIIFTLQTFVLCPAYADTQHTLGREYRNVRRIPNDQTRLGGTVIIYHLDHNGFNGQEDLFLHLRIKIKTLKGVKNPDFNVYLSFYNKSKLIQISDIKTAGERVSRGYGSILMTAIIHQLVSHLIVRYNIGRIAGKGEIGTTSTVPITFIVSLVSSVNLIMKPRAAGLYGLTRRLGTMQKSCPILQSPQPSQWMELFGQGLYMPLT